ncbi:MAG: hypothetical protein JO256_01410 [Alphaproteobacteria bacterium]|nr:hypothetical protein [Alphaproteobacteria bacterium]
MPDLKILRRVVIVSLVLQLALVGIGWAWPPFRPALLFGCMMTAAVAGMLYGRDLGRGFLAGMLGGGIAGAAGGVAAVAAAGWLGEHPESVIPYGVMVTMLTGAVGGFFGEVDARLRAYIVRKLTDRMNS